MTAQVTTTRRWAMTMVQAERGGSAAEVSVERLEREPVVVERRRVAGSLRVGLAARAEARRGGGAARGGAHSRPELNRRVVQAEAAIRRAGGANLPPRGEYARDFGPRGWEVDRPRLAPWG